MSSIDTNKTSPSFPVYTVKPFDRAVVNKRGTVEPAQAKMIHKHWVYDGACWPSPNRPETWYTMSWQFIARDYFHVLPAGTYTFKFTDGTVVNKTFTGFQTTAMYSSTPVGGKSLNAQQTRQYDWTTDNVYGLTLMSVQDATGNFYPFATSVLTQTHVVAPHSTGANDTTPTNIYIDVYPLGNSPSMSTGQAPFSELGKMLGADFTSNDRDTRYSAYCNFTRVNSAPGFANILGGSDNVAQVYSPATGTYEITYQNYFKPFGINYTGSGSQVQAYPAILKVEKNNDDLNDVPYHYMIGQVGSNYIGASNNVKSTFVIGSSSFGTNTNPNNFSTAQFLAVAKNFAFTNGFTLSRGTEGERTLPLAWQPVSGATLYTLYRSDGLPSPSSTPKNIIFQANGLSFADTSYVPRTGSCTYNYQVFATVPGDSIPSNILHFDPKLV